MKRIGLIVFVSLLAIGQAVAFLSMTHSTRAEYLQQQDDKVKIKKEELPEQARKTLSGDAFKGWSVENCYKTKEGEYQVDLKKGETLQTLRFDKDGKPK